MPVVRPPITMVCSIIVASILFGPAAHAARAGRTAADSVTAAQLEKKLRARSGPAAVITLADLKASLRNRRGKAVLLHLWATWCEPCLRELPMMARLARSLKPKNVDVLSVSLDSIGPRTTAEVAALIESQAGNELTRVVARIDNVEDFVAAIDPNWEGSIPALFGFDSTGVLAGALLGESTREEIDALVKDLSHVRTAGGNGTTGSGSRSP